MKTLENWKQKAGKQNSGGFSLVEVLVCIAILAIISVPILAGFSPCTILTVHIKRRQRPHMHRVYWKQSKAQRLKNLFSR